MKSVPVKPTNPEAGGMLCKLLTAASAFQSDLLWKHLSSLCVHTVFLEAASDAFLGLFSVFTRVRSAKIRIIMVLVSVENRHK